MSSPCHDSAVCHSTRCGVNHYGYGAGRYDASMRVAVVRGTSGEANTENGSALARAFSDLGVEVNVVDHEALIRNSTGLPIQELTNYIGSRIFKRPYNVTHRRKTADRQLLRQVHTFRPDLIVLIKGTYVSGALLREIRELLPAVRIFNWFTDNILYRPGVLGAIRELDHLFLKDSYVLDKVRRLELVAVSRMWEAADPGLNFPESSVSDREAVLYGAQISLVGSTYPYRANLLESLRGFDLRIWGGAYGFASAHEYSRNFAVERGQGSHLGARERNLVYNLSAINLNTVQPIECIHGSNHRTHDIAASAGFQLHEKVPDITNQYVDGAEIATFSSASELREKVKYYLANPDSAREIGTSAWRRALSEHTYLHRAQEFLDYFQKIKRPLGV